MALFDSTRAAVRWPGFRHVVFDCDSTLAGIEGIDELAETPGLREEIEDLTRRAMDGDQDLRDVYESRLALLQPDDQKVAALRTRYKQTAVHDAAALIAFLQAAGCEVYVVSGGLEEPVREFATYLGVSADHVAAVPLDHDQLSGAWWTTTERPARPYRSFADNTLTASDGKATAIDELTGGGDGGVLMVGDGESDARVGAELFVAFAGFVNRSAVTESAPVVISRPSLAPVAPLAVGPVGIEIEGGEPLFEAAASSYQDGTFRFNDADMESRFAAAMHYGSGA